MSSFGHLRRRLTGPPRWTLAVFGCLTLGCLASGGSHVRAQVRPTPGTAWVVLGADTVVAEVARTAEERGEGLMNREEVPDGTGMLFVFETPGIRSFWMKDTHVDLDLAYIDASYAIIDIDQMRAETEELHESDAPFMFGLEVRLGWLEEHGVEVGDTVQIVFGPEGGSPAQTPSSVSTSAATSSGRL